MKDANKTTEKKTTETKTTGKNTVEAMPESEFETTMQDVAKAYGAPAEVLADDRLDDARKLKLLQQWDYDLGLLLVAGEENMTGTGSGSTGERLRLVRECIARLAGEGTGGPSSGEKNPTGKVSGASMPGADKKPARSHS